MMRKMVMKILMVGALGCLKHPFGTLSPWWLSVNISLAQALTGPIHATMHQYQYRSHPLFWISLITEVQKKCNKLFTHVGAGPIPQTLDVILYRMWLTGGSISNNQQTSPLILLALWSNCRTRARNGVQNRSGIIWSMGNSQTSSKGIPITRVASGMVGVQSWY